MIKPTITGMAKLKEVEKGPEKVILSNYIPWTIWSGLYIPFLFRHCQTEDGCWH